MINKDSIHFHANELAELLTKKNHDYGNSVQEQFNEYGLDSILIRLDDKMRRLKSLRSKDPQVVGESLQDTLQDLSGYALLGLICLVHKEQPKHLQRCQYCGNILEANAIRVLDALVCSTLCSNLYISEKKPSYMDLDDE